MPNLELCLPNLATSTICAIPQPQILPGNPEPWHQSKSDLKDLFNTVNMYTNVKEMTWSKRMYEYNLSPITSKHFNPLNLQVPRDTKDQEIDRITNTDNPPIDSTTCSPSSHHSECAPEVYPYSPITTSWPCTPPPTTSHILSPIKDICDNTTWLLSPKKKHARTTLSHPSSPSPISVQPPDCTSVSELFVPAPYPRTEIEVIPDADTTEYLEAEWNGESTFWGSNVEFFNDKDGPDWDKRPIEDIPDPEGEDPEEDDTESEMMAKQKQFIFPLT
jgi:hypothetical protein